jgi:hypothetical protein
MHGKLSENPIVTAYALAIYDEDLPRKLIPALRDVVREMENEDQGIPTGYVSIDATLEPEDAESLTQELEALQEQQRQTKARIEQIQRALGTTGRPEADQRDQTAQTDRQWLQNVAADLRGEGGPSGSG